MKDSVKALISRHKSKLMAGGVVLLFMIMVLVPVSASSSQSFIPSSASASVTASVQVSPALTTSPVTYSTGINTSGIFSSIWGLLLSFGKSILNDFETLLGQIFGGLGGAVSTMFSNWATSLYGLGIWAPVIFVVVLAMAGFMLYFFMDVYGVEKDVLGGEEDL